MLPTVFFAKVKNNFATSSYEKSSGFYLLVLCPGVHPNLLFVPGFMPPEHRKSPNMGGSRKSASNSSCATRNSPLQNLTVSSHGSLRKNGPKLPVATKHKSVISGTLSPTRKIKLLRTPERRITVLKIKEKSSFFMQMLDHTPQVNTVVRKHSKHT